MFCTFSGTTLFEVSVALTADSDAVPGEFNCSVPSPSSPASFTTGTFSVMVETTAIFCPGEILPERSLFHDLISADVQLY